MQFIIGEINEIKIPPEYYVSILCTEKKIPWDQKVVYSELECKIMKSNRMLKLLPLIVENLVHVETGTNYQ